ncbi:cell division protein ZipA C-terminal FtsZ-binding domain-containing protein [Kushneria aurantia]|uniref:Cell division protein ZipA n=1 Tax=Kushneria aurantia TaxID=504092 RepID=A0ABV6G394_9GAMM|nr:cell division protein ZipA C-terminal FtsZ-binding domain-containing protein [Kushneria aurantia]
MELREWLIILGLVLVAIILVDGVRRLQRQRRGLRMDLSRDINADDPPRDQQDIERERQMSWELPNGGARVVSRHDDERPEPEAGARRTAAFDEEPFDDDRFDDGRFESDHFDDDRFDDHPDDRRRETRRGRTEAPRFTTPSLDDDIEPDDDDRFANDDRRDEPHFEDEPPRRRHDMARRFKSVLPFGRGRHDESEEDTDRSAPSIEPSHEPDPLFEREEPRLKTSAPRDDAPPPADDVAHQPAGVHRRAAFDAPTDAPPEEAPRHPAVERAARSRVNGEKAWQVLSDAEEVVVISVMSRDDEGFRGPDLLQLVLACGLRLDERGVFHRFEAESGRSPLQFSMVNVLKPGVFDLADIEEEGVPGVTFLMPLPSADSSRDAFEAMFETAMVLVRNLGGELKDENHSVMTAQTVEFARQRVHEFERRWRLHRHQAN